MRTKDRTFADMQNWELGGECLARRYTLSRPRTLRFLQPTHGLSPFFGPTWRSFITGSGQVRTDAARILRLGSRHRYSMAVWTWQPAWRLGCRPTPTCVTVAWTCVVLTKRTV